MRSISSLLEFKQDIDYPHFETEFDFQEFFLATVRENIAQKIAKIKEEQSHWKPNYSSQTFKITTDVKRKDPFDPEHYKEEE